MDYSNFMQSGNNSIIIVRVIFFFILFFVILMVRRGIKAGSKARNFTPDFIQRTGLTQQGNEFVGNYKEFSVSIKNDLSFNYAGMRNQKYRMYPRLHCRLTATGKNFPYTVLREKLNMLLYTDQRLNAFFSGKIQ